MNRIAIHSVPRSGSTWLGNIFNSHPNVAFRYQPLFSYAFKNVLTSSSSKAEIVHFFQNIAMSEDEFIHQKAGIERGIIPLFDKSKITHICYKEVRYHHLIENILEQDDELKLIGLIRNPMSVIHSWLNAPKEFKQGLGWKIEEEWRFAHKKNMGKPEEFNGFEKWKEVSILFEYLKDLYPDQFYLLEYNDLLCNTEAIVRDLFQFADLDFSDQTAAFIKESKSSSVQDAYSVYKQKERDDKWKEGLPRDIIQAIFNDLRSTSLEKYLKIK